MNDLIKRKFEDKEVISFVWNNKPCWIAIDIAELLNYTKKSIAVADCINREKFEVGLEYDILIGERLKVFKELFVEELGDTKYAAKVIILFEEGLYGFVSYTGMPIGKEFRSWLRRDLLPTIRKKGYYISNSIEKNFEDIKIENKVEKPADNLILEKHEITRLEVAYKSAKMFKDLLDNITMDNTYKFLLIKEIYLEAGINLPKYIEEERF